MGAFKPLDGAAIKGMATVNSVRFSLMADKNSKTEENDLKVMGLLVERLKTSGIVHETYSRNTPDGDKVDQIEITF